MSIFEGENLDIAKPVRSFLFNLGVTGATNIPLYETVDMFENLVKADPDQPYARFGLGFAQMIAGEYDVAHECFSHPCLKGTVYEDNARVHNAMAYFLDEDHSQGRAICDEILNSSTSDSVKELAKEITKNFG